MKKKRAKVEFIEIVPDAELQKKESEATEAMRRFYPKCGPVKLYRTADGRVGLQLQLAVTLGDRKRFDQAYRAVTKVLGERRGRPSGEKTVQAKLHLPANVFKALKKTAEEKHLTMSSVVADSLRRSLRPIETMDDVAAHP
jgi:hypothetical protein